MQYFWFGLLVFAINLLPAFAPPIWIIIVYYQINFNYNIFALIAVAVLTASTGRYLLGFIFFKFRRLLKVEYIQNLDETKLMLDNGRGKKLSFYALLFFSPLPSAQLFELAGLIGTNLKRVTLAFALGRCFTYTIYSVGAHTLKKSNLGQIIVDNIKSPWGIAIQVISILILIALAKKPPWKINYKNR